MLAEGIDIEAVLCASRDDIDLKLAQDRWLVCAKFHVTNPFRELLLMD